MAIESGRPDPWRRGAPSSGVVPAVWLAVATAVLVFAILTLASSWFRAQDGHARGGAPAAASPAADIDLWVGDLAPGVRCVLSSEWNDPAIDAAYDEDLNRSLGLGQGRGLAYYRLVVFNTTDKTVTLAFRDGQVVLTPKKGQAPLAMKSLASLVSGGAAASDRPSAQVAVLRGLGAGRETIDLPPGSRHSHPIAFERRVPLAEAVSVASADGTAFRPRRMPGRRWTGILEASSAADVKDL